MSELSEQGVGHGQIRETIHTNIRPPPPVPMLDIPSGVHQDTPQPPPAPDSPHTDTITEAYAHLAAAKHDRRFLGIYKSYKAIDCVQTRLVGYKFRLR